MGRRKKNTSVTGQLAGALIVLVVACCWFGMRKASSPAVAQETAKTEVSNTSGTNNADLQGQGSTEGQGTTAAQTADDAYEIPRNVSMKAPEQRLVRYAYTTSYNKDTRCPNWVGWALTAAHTDGEFARGGHKFIEDTDVPEPRAAYYDIRESECGYQRGHMCPAADNKWAYKAQKDAFLMTNICPQNGNLNQRDWKYLEEACRDWAIKYGKIYIVAGPLFRSKSYRTVGEHRVAVPDAFFKVVMTLGKDNRQPKAIGFMYENQSGHRKMQEYACTVDDVEKATGLDFFYQLDDSVESRIEAQCNLSAW